MKFIHKVFGTAISSMAPWALLLSNINSIVWMNVIRLFTLSVLTSGDQ
uniref:Uncharacterized protein n=1 Tax=Parascaris equorum TaxID=6256 RepID=A0A914RIP2_PAREQ